MQFPMDFVRESFPALAERDRVFLDNAAGTQVPLGVVDVVSGRLTPGEQIGGGYRSSEGVDATLQHARESAAVFLNANEPEEVVFGPNATAFIRLVSAAYGELLTAGDQIVVTELDHEANIAPWLALEKLGIEVKFWSVESDARLDVGKLDALLTDRTRLVAVTKASNAVGTIVDLIPVAERIHAIGGHLFVDAGHFAAHGPLDVRFFGCDFLVCSGYKAFGPHMGFLWGKRELMDSLSIVREDFVEGRTPDEPVRPAKYESGTDSYEAVAGMDAAIAYIEELGRRSSEMPLAPQDAVGRRGDIRRGMQAIRHYERDLTGQLLRRVGEISGVKIHGIDGPHFDAYRTPTLCFSVQGVAPQEVSRQLAQQGISVGDGHHHCPVLMRSLGLSESEGAVRASFVHYNTYEEVNQFADALAQISAGVKVAK